MGGASGEAEASTGNEVRAMGARPVSGAPAGTGLVTGAPAGAGSADLAAGAAPAGGARSAERYPDQSVRLVLWRHGQTQWNAEGRFQGQSDIPLDPEGERQAERSARLLAALQAYRDLLIRPLARAMATAAPLARLTGLTVTLDKDLRERYGGEWEGLTDAEIRASYPDAHSRWLPPGGETSAAVADRAAAAMDRIAETLAPGTLAVVVSHGAALRLGAARLLGLPRNSGARSARWRTAPGRSWASGAADGGCSNTTPEPCRSRC